MLNVYEAIGGEATFLRLTDAFYDRVAADSGLRALFPPNMGPGKRRLALFMIESLGGPPLWSRERHFLHLIRAHHTRDFTEEQRDSWVNHMLTAIDQIGITGPARPILREWVISSADFALNHPPHRPVQLLIPE